MTPANNSSCDSAQEFVLAPFTVIIDSREQSPWLFTNFKTDKTSKGGPRPLVVQTRVEGLPSGDYSIDGFQQRVAIERKSLEDLYGTLGGGRDRFTRELERLSTYDRAAVVVEASMGGAVLPQKCPGCGGVFLVASCPTCNGLGVINPVPRSSLSPKSVFRSMIAWSIEYPTIAWHFADSRRLAEVFAWRWLVRWHEKRAPVILAAETASGSGDNGN